MITKKDWDALPLSIKKDILSTIYGNDCIASPLLKEYHHNFDYDATGRTLKRVLSQLYRVTADELYIKVPVQYNSRSTEAKFVPSPEKVKKAPTTRISPVERSKWQCDYISKGDHDVAHVWCYADSREEARSYFQSEYWDIDEIIDIYKV